MNSQETASVILEDVKPIYIVSKLFGLVPYTRDVSGNFHFKLISFSSIYSLSFFMLVGSGIYDTVYKLMHSILNSHRSFSFLVFPYVAAVLLLMHLVLVPMHWMESISLASVMRQWNEFQVEFQCVTSTNLKIKMRNKAIFHSLLGPVLGISAFVIVKITANSFTMKLSEIYNLAMSTYALSLLYVTGALWLLLCKCLSIAGSCLLQCFIKDTLQGSASVELTEKYRKLWLLLSRLTRECGTSKCFTVSSIIIFWFLVMLISLYGAVINITKYSLNFQTCMSLLSFFSSLLFLLKVCTTAENVTCQIGTKFHECISSSLMLVEEDIKHELLLFLTVMEAYPPIMTLGGFFTVNMHLFSSIMMTIATYLIVMLQFSIYDIFGKKSEDMN